MAKTAKTKSTSKRKPVTKRLTPRLAANHNQTTARVRG